MNLRDVAAHWVALHEALGLGGPVRDEAHYSQLLEVVAQLMEEPAVVDAGPLGGLVALLAERIGAYEAQQHPWPDTATPAQVLRALMDEHGLAQRDLPELGSQGVVSELLRGKRCLNLRQVQALAQRFAVPMEVFAPHGP
jgi:HTH-type transcriptional regulator/antitoxin HigA